MKTIALLTVVYIPCLCLTVAWTQSTNPDENPDEMYITRIDRDPVLPPQMRRTGVTPPAAVARMMDGPMTYKGAQLWRVATDSKAKLKVLAGLRDNKDISMWGGNTSAIDIFVPESRHDAVSKALNDSSMMYSVIIRDVQEAINRENPVIENDQELENRQGHRMNWYSYHRLADIHNFMDYLAQTYPNLCTVRLYGKSFEGRPLKLLKISNGRRHNKAMWVDGGIHAREWISPASVSYIINELVLNFDSQPEYIKNTDWYIAPVVNPDGYEYSHTNDRLWRKNRRSMGGGCVGVDLNRNFGYKWGGKGNGKNPCQEIYGGTGPFSEPESQAIRDFITNEGADWRGYVSFHAYGQYILYPWGYDRLVPVDHHDLSEAAKQAICAIQSVNGPTYKAGPSGSLLYPAAGGSDDWAKGALNFKYAYTIELRDAGRYGFILPSHFIRPSAQDALAALKAIAQAAYST